MASTTHSTSRGPILAALTGLLLLGLVVLFTLGLNAADDGSDAEHVSASAGDPNASTDPIDLPEVLPGDLVSVTSTAMPVELSDQLGGAKSISDSLAKGADGIAGLYGAPAALAIYGRTDQSALVTIAVATTEGGLFLPDGLPPLDPADLGVVRAAQVLEEHDGAVCNVGYAEAVETGQTVDEAELPTATTCQYEQDGRTYQLSGNGLFEDEAVTALKALAAYAAGDTSAVPDVSDLPAPPPVQPPAPAPTAPAPAPTTPAPAPTAPAPTR